MNIILFEKLPEENRITLKDNKEIFTHITQVLKLKEKDSFSMGIINESEGEAVIKKIEKCFIEFEYYATDKPFLFPVTLLVAYVRPICMKRILREAVTLGVSRIMLCATDTGEKSYMLSNLYKTDEYKWYLKEGAMQSKYAGLPEVLFFDNVQNAVNYSFEFLNKKAKCSFYLLDNICTSVSLSSVSFCECKSKESALLAVGPERGWSDRERKIFTQAGFEVVNLGKRVLRTETACSTGIALLLSRMKLL